MLIFALAALNVVCDRLYEPDTRLLVATNLKLEGGR